MTASNEEHFVGKIAQKAIIVKGDSVLLLRDPRDHGEIWELPGGRMNVGEEPRKALARELFEELGCECLIHEVVYMEQFKQGNEGSNAFMIAYRATMLNPNESFTLDSTEVAEARFVRKDELQTLTLFPQYERALEIFYQQSPSIL